VTQSDRSKQQAGGNFLKPEVSFLSSSNSPAHLCPPLPPKELKAADKLRTTWDHKCFSHTGSREDFVFPYYPVPLCRLSLKILYFCVSSSILVAARKKKTQIEK
jgi:hypothetical protein